MQNRIRRRRRECCGARHGARQRHDSDTYNTLFHSHAILDWPAFLYSYT
jgi:hypothetical protein